MAFLDNSGVAYLWSKIKSYVSGVLPSSHADLAPLYGTCATAAKTAAKTTTISGVTELKTGLTIFVRFTNANGVANPTLKVNDLDAKAIKRYGTTAPSTSAASSWNAGQVCCLVYDGTYWMLCDWNNTSYSSMSQAEATTGTATSARVITAKVLATTIDEHLADIMDMLTYSVTNNLTGCSTSNATTSLMHKDSYTATITPERGKKITEIKITMGGIDITDSVWTGVE